MHTYLLTLLLAGSLTAAAHAQASTPGGPHPTAAVAQLHGDVLILQKRVESYNTIYKIVKYEQDGGWIEKKVPASVPVSLTVEQAVGAGDFRIFDLAGKLLSAEVAAERLAEPTTVLTSSHGSKVDPQLLQVFRPDTLIIYLRPAPPSPYSMMGPPPAPVAPRSTAPGSVMPPADRPPPPPLPAAT